MRLYLLWLFLGIITTHSVYSQRISGVTAERVGVSDSIKITYTLSDPSPERIYEIDIFALTRKDTFQLFELTGGVGDSVTAGTHIVYWDAISELGRFRGPMSFRIKAIPSFLINDPKAGLSIKRGDPVSFTWYGGNSHIDDLTMVLYQYDNEIDTLKIVSNVNKFTWQIPEKMLPGKGYRVKIIGTEKTNINSFTNDFTITRRIPLYYIIAPAAAVVTGVIAYLILKREPLPPIIDPDGE